MSRTFWEEVMDGIDPRFAEDAAKSLARGGRAEWKNDRDEYTDFGEPVEFSEQPKKSSGKGIIAVISAAAAALVCAVGIGVYLNTDSSQPMTEMDDPPADYLDGTEFVPIHENLDISMDFEMFERCFAGEWEIAENRGCDKEYNGCNAAIKEKIRFDYFDGGFPAKFIYREKDISFAQTDDGVYMFYIIGELAPPYSFNYAEWFIPNDTPDTAYFYCLHNREAKREGEWSAVYKRTAEWDGRDVEPGSLLSPLGVEKLKTMVPEECAELIYSVNEGGARYSPCGDDFFFILDSLSDSELTYIQRYAQGLYHGISPYPDKTCYYVVTIAEKKVGWRVRFEPYGIEEINADDGRIAEESAAEMELSIFEKYFSGQWELYDDRTDSTVEKNLYLNYQKDCFTPVTDSCLGFAYTDDGAYMFRLTNGELTTYYVPNYYTNLMFVYRGSTAEDTLKSNWDAVYQMIYDDNDDEVRDSWGLSLMGVNKLMSQLPDSLSASLWQEVNGDGFDDDGIYWRPYLKDINFHLVDFNAERVDFVMQYDDSHGGYQHFRVIIYKSGGEVNISRSKSNSIGSDVVTENKEPMLFDYDGTPLSEEDIVWISGADSLDEAKNGAWIAFGGFAWMNDPFYADIAYNSIDNADMYDAESGSFNIPDGHKYIPDMYRRRVGESIDGLTLTEAQTLFCWDNITRTASFCGCTASFEGSVSVTGYIWRWGAGELYFAPSFFGNGLPVMNFNEEEKSGVEALTFGDFAYINCHGTLISLGMPELEYSDEEWYPAIADSRYDPVKVTMTLDNISMTYYVMDPDSRFDKIGEMMFSKLTTAHIASLTLIDKPYAAIDYDGRILSEEEYTVDGDPLKTLEEADEFSIITVDGYAWVNEPTGYTFNSIDDPELYDKDKKLFNVPKNYSAPRRISVGDTVCGLTVTSAQTYLDWIAYSGTSIFNGCSIRFDGSAELTGYLVSKDWYDFGIQELYFVPAYGTAGLPAINYNEGMFEWDFGGDFAYVSENHTFITLGTVEDYADAEWYKALPQGDFCIKADITVEDVWIYSLFESRSSRGRTTSAVITALTALEEVYG